jgi:anti-sigma factor RsiW
MMHGHVRSRLSAYLEGDLGAREESALEAHLAECAPCTAELRALRRAIDLLHGLSNPEMPSDIGGAVLERLRNGEGAPRSLLARVSWVRLAPFALAAGIGAAAYLTQVEDTRVAVDVAGVESLPVVAAQVPAPASPVAAPVQRVGTPVDLFNGQGAAQRMVVSPFLVCLARFRTGKPAGADCAAWDAYLLQLASEDAPRFYVEVGGFPKSHQQAIMDRLSLAAALSGSATTVGTTLRDSQDPQIRRFAPRFERSQSAPLLRASWDGR